MSLWNSKQEDLTTKIGTKEKLATSGIYAAEIKEAYLKNSNQSKAKAVTLSFESENNYGRVSFWFLKADGTENPFATKASASEHSDNTNPSNIIITTPTTFPDVISLIKLS